jgi:hypothetical protein
LAHWPLNEPSGTRANVLGPLSLVAYGDYQQLSGVDLGADGVLHAKDPTNLAPHFKGTSASVDVAYQAVLNPMNVDFSVELWVKPDAASGTDEQTVISSHRFDSMNKQQGYEVDLVRVPTESHQQVRARVYSGGNATDVVVQPIQGDPQGWRYVLLTFQAGAAGSGTVKLYARVLGDLNLLQAGQSNAPYQNVGSANPSTLRFGASHRMNQAAGNFFAGRIDEVAFYNSVLVSTDIDKRFNKV